MMKGLYKRKDSPFYWMAFSVDKKPYRISTGTADKKLAQNILAKVKTKIIEGEWFLFAEGKDRTLGEMLERYEKEFSARKHFARERSIIKHLLNFFGNCTLRKVEDKISHYEEYRKQKDVSPATIHKELSLLRAAFNIARKQWKWKISNPVSDIKLPSAKNERVRYLSDDERQRLFEALEKTDIKWIEPVVILAMETGLRLSNICDLRWLEVNLFSRTITISAENMKNEETLAIPLTDKAFNILKKLQKENTLSEYVLCFDGKKIYGRKIQRAFKKVLKAAQIENFRFHDLRHCFASCLAQAGETIDVISVLLGHKDLRMTKRYTHLDIEILRKAISKVDFTILSREDRERRSESI